MKTLNLIRALAPMALLFAASSASAQQAPTKNYRIDIKLPPKAEASAKPASGDARSSAASVFTRVPATVQLVGSDGVKLSLTATSAASPRLSVATGGKSQCIRVFAQRADYKPMPMEFSIVKRGDVDPCTGKAPIGPMLDLKANEPAPQPYTHKYWKLACQKGKGCHWVLVTCTHAPGVP